MLSLNTGKVSVLPHCFKQGLFNRGLKFLTLFLYVNTHRWGYLQPFYRPVPHNQFPKNRVVSWLKCSLTPGLISQNYEFPFGACDSHINKPDARISSQQVANS